MHTICSQSSYQDQKKKKKFEEVPDKLKEDRFWNGYQTLRFGFSGWLRNFLTHAFGRVDNREHSMSFVCFVFLYLLFYYDYIV